MNCRLVAGVKTGAARLKVVERGGPAAAAAAEAAGEGSGVPDCPAAENPRRDVRPAGPMAAPEPARQLRRSDLLTGRISRAETRDNCRNLLKSACKINPSAPSDIEREEHVSYSQG